MKTDKNFNNKSFITRSIHVGNEPDSGEYAVVPPIYLAANFVYKDLGLPKGTYEYSRSANPTRDCLQRNYASLNNARYGIALSSGMGAIYAVLSLLSPGDHIITFDDCFGGTYKYITQNKKRLGYEVDFVDLTNLTFFEKTIKKSTRMVILESLSNPTCKVPNLKKIAEICKKYNILTVIDNTFLSPYNYSPLSDGIDITFESATKYIGGHSDLTMGVIATNSEELYRQLSSISNGIGASPFDCYLALRSIKTLVLRMDKHNENALRIAEFLEAHPKVEKINYPGLVNNQYYSMAKENKFKGCGGVLSFYIKGAGIEETKQFFHSLKIFTYTTSLGATESLAEWPWFISKGSVPDEVKSKLNISFNFIRLAVGLEDVEELKEDLDQALNNLSRSDKINQIKTKNIPPKF